MTRRTRFRGGFTLIELLVVVAIIALLISILTPSLGRARQQAKSAVCLSRLHELMKATIAYTSDFQGQMPPISYPARKDSSQIKHGWAEALYRVTYQDKDFSLDKNYPVMCNDEGRFELWADKEGRPAANSTGHYRVYEISWSKGSLDLIKHRVPLIMDANPVVKDKLDLERADIPKEHIAGLQDEAYIDERHYGGANYSFNDGHAVRDPQLKRKLAEDWDLDPDTPNE